MLAFFLKTRLGNVLGLLGAAAVAGGVIYYTGRSDEREVQHVKQLKANETATKQRREIDRAVPRTDWDDRVDELQ